MNVNMFASLDLVVYVGMHVDEAKGACKHRSMWCSVVFA